MQQVDNENQNLISDFLDKFSKLNQDDVIVEKLDESKNENKWSKIVPIKISGEIDGKDFVITYGKNKQKKYTYQLEYDSKKIQFYSDGYLKINDGFVDKNYNNNPNGTADFKNLFTKLNKQFQKFVSYIEDNKSEAEIDTIYPYAKFTQHKMRQELRKNYDKTSYKDNKDGTFDVKLGKNQYKAAFIHFQPTFKDLYLDADYSHKKYTYEKLDKNFLEQLFEKHKKKSATIVTFNNDKCISTTIHSTPPFSVGAMFGKDCDIFTYSMSPYYLDNYFISDKLQANYQKTQRHWKELYFIDLARNALQDKNLEKNDKYKVLFSNLENRQKFDKNNKDSDGDFYFNGDEALMITKGENNQNFDISNFCIQMFFQDPYKGGLLSTRVKQINEEEPLLKWDKPFEYGYEKYPNGIKPEVEKIVEANKKLGHKCIWILDYGNKPYTMIKVQNSVNAVKEYFDYRYNLMKEERQRKQKIDRPFMPKDVIEENIQQEERNTLKPEQYNDFITDVINKTTGDKYNDLVIENPTQFQARTNVCGFRRLFGCCSSQNEIDLDDIVRTKIQNNIQTISCKDLITEYLGK